MSGSRPTPGISGMGVRETLAELGVMASLSFVALRDSESGVGA
jgi:hypothetical protein